MTLLMYREKVKLERVKGNVLNFETMHNCIKLQVFPLKWLLGLKQGKKDHSLVTAWKCQNHPLSVISCRMA